MGRAFWASVIFAVEVFMAVGEWRERRRPCVVCGDRPSDAAAGLCGPCLVWDRGARRA